MRTEAEYRAEAAQFIRQADNAKNSNHRMSLMEHAKALTRMADEAARMERTVEPKDRMVS